MPVIDPANLAVRDIDAWIADCCVSRTDHPRPISETASDAESMIVNVPVRNYIRRSRRRPMTRSLSSTPDNPALTRNDELRDVRLSLGVPVSSVGDDEPRVR